MKTDKYHDTAEAVVNVTAETSETGYDNPPLGCYFDGCFGQEFNDGRVLDLAYDYGWKGVQDSIDAVSDAVEYLNSLETRPNTFWQWIDGDFGLYLDEDEPEYGTLHDYKTGLSLRPATKVELKASKRSAKLYGGEGIIMVEGRSAYVQE
jgi:hypothetical protein